MLAPALLLACAVGAADARPAVSVLYFDNATGKAEFDVLRKGLADLILTDLVAWDGVRVIEREKLEDVLGELKLQASKAFDQTTAVKVGKLVGARYLLTGTMITSGHDFVLSARLIDVEERRVVTAASVKGYPDKVFELEQELVDKITLGIDLKVKNQSARRKVKVPDLDTLVAYSKAIDLSDRGQMEEAQQAMAAVVSRAPAFLMARERKAAILQKLKEYEKRRADLVTDSVRELARRAEEELKAAPRFDELDERQQARLLSYRQVRGAVLTRMLKPHLTSRDSSLRMPLAGHEPEVRKLVVAWLDNHRRYMDEVLRFTSQGRSSLGVELPAEVQNLLRDAKMSLRMDDGVGALLRFVVEGRCQDGDAGFTLAPTPGDLDPKELTSVLGFLDGRIEATLAAAKNADASRKLQTEHQATHWLQEKAEMQLSLGRDEEAIATYQRLLDAFPASDRAPWVEKQIEKLVGAAHDDRRDKRERWAKAMKDGCADDMDIRVATGTLLHEKLRHLGLEGLAAHAAELEQACKPTPRNRGAFASVYSDLAMTSARHEDCEGFRRWMTRYLEHGGSVGDMQARQRNSAPWCELGDIERKVTWLHAKQDGSWNLEFDRHLVSVQSYDGKVLTLMASKEGQPQSFDLRLTREKPEGPFTCEAARWQRSNEDRWEGTCSVTLTRLAAENGEHDEGSFTATLKPQAQRGAPAPEARRMELSAGSFRLRRE